MAKMFYTLEEAAERLGLDEGQIKEMAGSGKLQQFRDRDKLMFKRDQVDQMADADATTEGSSLGGVDLEGSSLGIELADPGPDDTDAISLADDSMLSDDLDDTEASGNPVEDPREATGISVFDAGEIEPADPMAQTQMNQPNIDDEELALESVGSGSGLLDLTRESDDTSLGAELLDEIYPGGGDSATPSTGGDFSLDSSVGSSGVFEGSMTMETGTSGPSGLENLTEADPGSVDVPLSADMGGDSPVTMVAAEEYDPAGSALGAGLLLGATVALIIALAVVVAAIAGSRSSITSALVDTNGASKVMFLCIGLLVVSFLFGGVGMFLGRNAR